MPLHILLSGNDSTLLSEAFEQFKKGDKASFKAIYEYYYNFLYYFLHRLIGNPEEARDIASDAFVTLWKNRASIKEAGALKSYLVSVARNSGMDYLKKQKVARRYMLEVSRTTDEAAHVGTSLIHGEFFYNLDQLATELPPGCRSVFEMIYYQNLGTGEIAERLRISPQTVLNQKNKAIHLLRKWVVMQNNILLLEFFEAFIRHH